MPSGVIQEIIVGCRASSELKTAARQYMEKVPQMFQASEDLRGYRIHRDLIKANQWSMTSHF